MCRMKRALITLGLTLWTANLARAQTTIVGDWEGTLKAGGIELRLALHVVQADDGGFKATLDNIDQGGFRIPASVALAGTKLTLRIEALRGSYEGTVSANGTAIDGTWSQGVAVPLAFARAPKRADVAPSDIDGAWAGTLNAAATTLRLVVHITNTPYGLVATMDSLDQGVRRLVATASRNGSSLKLDVKQVNGTFEGKIDDARTTIDGTWSQGGPGLPLVLALVKDAAALVPRRPQNPVKPYPYREEDVAYENRAANITL